MYQNTLLMEISHGCASQVTQISNFKDATLPKSAKILSEYLNKRPLNCGRRNAVTAKHRFIFVQGLSLFCEPLAANK